MNIRERVGNCSLRTFLLVVLSIWARQFAAPNRLDVLPLFFGHFPLTSHEHHADVLALAVATDELRHKVDGQRAVLAAELPCKDTHVHILCMAAVETEGMDAQPGVQN